MRVACSLLLCSLLLCNVQAQVGEVGLHVGKLYYSGDLQVGKLQAQHKTVDVGLFYRFLLNEPFSLRTNLILGKLSGDDTNPPDILGVKRAYSFEIFASELSTLLEYRFLPPPSKYAVIKLTPYVFAGLGGLFFSGYDNPIAEFSNFQPVIPFGLGVKCKLDRNFVIGIDFSMHKTFFDYLDNTSASSFRNKDYSHGDMYNTDWYHYISVSVSYAAYALRCPFLIKKEKKKY